MLTQKLAAILDDEKSLAARAAWLHFIGGMTQGEVAARLQIPNVKAHRLITRASREGMIRVFVDGDVAECVKLEQRLRQLYGLSFCEVAPDIESDPLPLRTLGVLGARFLRTACDTEEDAVIGLGHGRTLAACVEHLPRGKAGNIRFVSLLGGFTRRFSAHPFDVISRIAERTGVEAFVLPVPFCLNSAEDRAVIMAQKGIDAVFDLARKATLRFVGIGTADGGDASLVSSGMIEPHEFEEIERAGGCGEVLGHFFDKHGGRVETDLTGRLASLSYDDLKFGKLVAVAGGVRKPAAIRAVLQSGLLHGLLTDERTAQILAGPRSDP